jgi:hypothetical protein
MSDEDVELLRQGAIGEAHERISPLTDTLIRRPDHVTVVTGHPLAGVVCLPR